MTGASRGRRFAAPLAILMLVAIAFSGCLGAGGSGGTPDINVQAWRSEGSAGVKPVGLLGDPARSGTSGWPGAIDAPVAVGDIDGDGTSEFVGHSSDGSVYVYRSDGRLLAQLETKYPPSWYVQSVLNAPKIATMEPGEPASIVVTNHAAYISEWRYDPAGSSSDEWAFEKKWEVRADGCHQSPGMDGGPAVADLDGDGDMEVVVQVEEVGLFGYDTDGTKMWQQCWAGGNSAPVIDDLEDDGTLEAVFASDSGVIAVLDGQTGAPQWTYDARADTDIHPASVVVSPTVADIDGELPKEVLFTARYAPEDDPDLFETFNVAIFAVHESAAGWQGELVWMQQPEWANPMSDSSMVVKTMPDGEVAIFGLDWNTIGHRPGDWQNLGPAHVFRLDAEGEEVWMQEVDSWWSNKQIAVVDADGDGEPEVLVESERDGEDGFWRLSAETGKKEGFLGVAPWKVLRGPTVIALGPDDEMHLAFPVRALDESDERGAIMVVGLGVPMDG